MTKIPKAEEILNKHYVHTTYHPNGYPYNIQWHDDECVFCRDYQDKVEKAMIEFAKIHVKTALESTLNFEVDGCGCGESDVIKNHINSILFTYPEELIK